MISFACDVHPDPLALASFIYAQTHCHPGTLHRFLLWSDASMRVASPESAFSETASHLIGKIFDVELLAVECRDLVVHPAYDAYHLRNATDHYYQTFIAAMKFKLLTLPSLSIYPF
jgi:hypothetical protein